MNKARNVLTPKIRIKLLIGTSLILLVSIANAQDFTTQSTEVEQEAVAQIATFQRDPNAVLVLSQCAQSMGTSNLSADTLSEGQISYGGLPNNTFPVVIKTKSNHGIRNEIALPDGPVVSVVNNGAGDTRTGARRTKLPISAIAFARPEQIPAFACRYSDDNPYLRLIYVGLEDVKGVQAHHVKIYTKLPRDPGGVNETISEYHVFIDAKSFVVLKTQTYTYSPDSLENRSVWETYFSDYRIVDGVLMPFKLERYSGNQKHSDIVFTSHHLNQVNADSDFLVEATDAR